MAQKPKLDYGAVYKLVDKLFPSIFDKLKAYRMWTIMKHLWKNTMERARGQPITPLPGYKAEKKRNGK